MGLKKIAIDTKELSNLKNVGSGIYGIVFADEENEFVIKQYHENVKSEFGWDDRNPCLVVKTRKFKRLNDRDKKIKYTDTAVELVYDGLSFIGVKKKYYKGATLDKLSDKSFSAKKEILRKLIRNSRELYKNRIYNLDGKIDNALVTCSGEVKILDLDDICTKVTLLPNPIYELICLKKLQEVIINVMYNNQLGFGFIINKRLGNKPENNEELKRFLSYSHLQRLVDSIKFEENIAIIDYKEIGNIDINLLRNYLNKNGLVLVLAVDRKKRYYYDFLVEKIDYLADQGIAVYDVFRQGDNYEEAIDNYINSHGCSNSHVYHEGFKVLEKK